MLAEIDRLTVIDLVDRRGCTCRRRGGIAALALTWLFERLFDIKLLPF